METTELRFKTQTCWVETGILRTNEFEHGVRVNVYHRSVWCWSRAQEAPNQTKTRDRMCHTITICTAWSNPWSLLVIQARYMEIDEAQWRWEGFNVTSGKMTTIEDAHAASYARRTPTPLYSTIHDWRNEIEIVRCWTAWCIPRRNLHHEIDIDRVDSKNGVRENGLSF